MAYISGFGACAMCWYNEIVEYCLNGGEVTFKPNQPENEIILETSLQAFFFDQLIDANKKFQSPLPNETIYYSSLVMDKFGHSKEYFDVIDGKVRDKILGVKLLESSHLQKREQQRELKDIGDTALLLCGFFYDSINEKIVDYRYYKEIGQIAYSRLNSYVPSFYDVNAFYKNLSKQFDTLATIMQIVQRSQNDYKNDGFTLFLTDKKLKVS